MPLLDTFAVYDGCGGSQLACNDGFVFGILNCSGGGEDAAVTIDVTAGVSLAIQVGGWGGETGNSTLVIAPVSPPTAVIACTSSQAGLPLGCGDNCPCDNQGFGFRGCLNSVGDSAELLKTGSTSVSLGEFQIGMCNGVPGAFAILVSGAAVAPQNPSNPCFGANSGVQSVVLDGLRCAVQSLQRHGVRQLDALGEAGLDSMNPGWGESAGPSELGFVAGDQRAFQIFYRDDPTLVCMTGQNTTQALIVTFIP